MTDSRFHRLAPLLLVAGAAIFAHARTLGAGLVYDDRVAILEDSRLGTLEGALEILVTPYWGSFARDPLYRPVTSLTFALGRALHGASPAWNHAANLALHALAAALLLRLLRTLFPARPGAAIAASLLFACHPALSEAVAGVVGRAEILAAVFTLGAVLATLRGPGRPWAAALLSALAFLSKESAAGLALAIPLAAALRPDGRTRAAAFLRSALPLAALLGAALLLRANALSSTAAAPGLSGVENPLRDAPAAARAVTALHVLGRYALLLLFPIRLRSDASFAEITVLEAPGDAFSAAGAAGLSALAALAAVAGSRGRPIALAAILALLPLLIVSNLFFPIGTVYGERLLYLPALGLAGIAAGAPVPRLGRRAAIPLAAATLLFAARTIDRERIYASEERFFREMVADSPLSAKAWTNFAIALRTRDAAGADRALDRALEILPGMPLALAEKGALAAERGDAAAAEGWFRRAIAAHPEYADAHLRLGQILSNGPDANLMEAGRRFEDAMRLDPSRPDAAYGLGAVRFRQGSKDEALDLFEEAIRRDSRFAHGYYGRATVRFAARDLAGAESDLRRAIELAPDLAEPVRDWLEKPARADSAVAEMARRLGVGPR